MPVSYSGTVAEHNAVRAAPWAFRRQPPREGVGRGASAAQFCNATLSNDLGKIAPGKAQYTMCCSETGGVVDDLIAYLVSDDEVFLVPNAANTATVVAALQAVAPAGIGSPTNTATTACWPCRGRARRKCWRR